MLATCNILSLVNKACSCNELSYAKLIKKTIDAQRLSPSGRVKPQAYGGRKIPPLIIEYKGVQIVCTLRNCSGVL